MSTRTNDLPQSFALTANGKVRDIRVHAAVASLLLSFWCIATTDVINFDGIVYVRAAELFGQGEWAAALRHYKWPFYSLLTAAVGQIPGVSYELAAQLINALTAVLIVVAFITLVGELGGDKRALVAAAVVILLYPSLIRYRAAVLRDFGYLAFYLLSLVYFFRYARQPDWRTAIAWFASIGVAGLFRLEGIAFMLAMPLLLLWLRADNRSERLTLFTLSPAVLVAIFLVSAWWFGAEQGVGVLGMAVHFATDLFRLNMERVDAIRDQVLTSWMADNAWAVYVATLMAIFLNESIRRMTPLLAILVGHAWYRKLIFPAPGARSIWLGLIFIHAGILFAILVYRFLITSRFPLALSLTLLLAAPFSLVVLYDRWQERRHLSFSRNWVFPTVCSLLVLMAGYELTREALSANHKRHLRAAGHWVQEHTPAGARVFSNEARLALYAGRYGPTEYIRRYEWGEVVELVQRDYGHYDFLAIYVHHRHPEHAQEIQRLLGLEPIKTFANPKGSTVLIFKTKPDR